MLRISENKDNNATPKSTINLTRLPKAIELSLSKFFELVGIRPDREYVITACDSGAGGAFAMLEALRYCKPFLDDVHNNYAVKFVFNHYGDTENAPYGDKNPEVVTKLSSDLITKGANLFDSRLIVIACNSASAVYNKNSYEIEEKAGNTKIKPIIFKSAKFLLNQSFHFLTPEQKESSAPVYIPYLATEYTVKSGEYEKEILKQCSKENEKYFYNFTKKDENGKIIDKIKKEVKIVSYNPPTWVKLIESGAPDEEIAKQVKEDITNFVNKVKSVNNQLGYQDKDVVMPALGMFCTHYPIIKGAISDALAENGFSKEKGNNVELLSQGEVISKIIVKFIKRDLDILSKRSGFDSVIKNIGDSVKIKSYVTGPLDKFKDVLEKLLDHFSKLGSTGLGSNTKYGKDKLSVGDTVELSQIIETHQEHELHEDASKIKKYATKATALLIGRFLG